MMIHLHDGAIEGPSWVLLFWNKRWEMGVRDGDMTGESLKPVVRKTVFCLLPGQQGDFTPITLSGVLRLLSWRTTLLSSWDGAVDPPLSALRPKGAAAVL